MLPVDITLPSRVHGFVTPNGAMYIPARAASPAATINQSLPTFQLPRAQLSPQPRHFPAEALLDSQDKLQVGSLAIRDDSLQPTEHNVIGPATASYADSIGDDCKHGYAVHVCSGCYH
jgi:hypothetical protein